MEVSKHDLMTRREDDHRYYVSILTDNGMYRLYEPRNINDVMVSLKAFCKLGDEEAWDPSKWAIKYKQVILSSSMSLISIPRGAVLEAIRL